MNHKIAIVTPVKNEIHNLPNLISSINNQSESIFCWVILENDSTDDSYLFLEKERINIKVENLHLLKLEFENKEYQLGFKYSSIIKTGFDFLKTQNYFNELDFIGILDSDCFPEPEYFAKLIHFMNQDPLIGIASGILLINKDTKGFSSSKHVRGSGRLWKKKCFDDSGYFIGMSADSISRIKANLRGWKSAVYNSAIFYSREANTRVSLEYGGKSAYYNGFTFGYVFVKSISYLFHRPKHGIQYFLGYVKSYVKRELKNPDFEIIQYNRKMLLNKFKNFLNENSHN